MVEVVVVVVVVVGGGSPGPTDKEAASSYNLYLPHWKPEDSLEALGWLARAS